MKYRPHHAQLRRLVEPHPDSQILQISEQEIGTNLRTIMNNTVLFHEVELITFYFTPFLSARVLIILRPNFKTEYCTTFGHKIIDILFSKDLT